MINPDISETVDIFRPDLGASKNFAMYGGRSKTYTLQEAPDIWLPHYESYHCTIARQHALCATEGNFLYDQNLNHQKY